MSGQRPTESRKLYVVATSFGPFKALTVSPSDHILQKLIDNFQKWTSHPLGTEIHLFDTKFLAVDADQIDEYVTEVRDQILAFRVKNPDAEFLFMPVGINRWLPPMELELERRCFNARSFVNQHEFIRDYQVPINSEISRLHCFRSDILTTLEHISAITCTIKARD